jgi:hypothetical protein
MMGGSGASWGLTAPSQLLYQITLTWDALNAKWNEWILAYGPDNQGQFMEWLGMDDPDWQKMMFTLIAVIVVLVAVISALIMRRYRPPPADRATRLYRRFILAAGIEAGRGETPLRLAARMVDEDAAPAGDAVEITGLYLDARYGPPGLASVERLRDAVQRFVRHT